MIFINDKKTAIIQIDLDSGNTLRYVNLIIKN
ncbi:hypothetical protein P344_02320 [Spiroplasma mirum ATCC 29335]|uniref:Uncharacterized protein n=1 Tax=Spiroplasma mirum ATCC 29335 TaxID=838561 RepID=W6ALC8_9MOLU|nr:hypothetical protein P344_02320 [Spiroplasma mirum ATCC 29335]AKM52943.1 hypothetical protein SATRI_v1c04400 [Spiroplasma atrichopogonis]